MPRKSKQKEAILNFLRSTSSHPTANYIYEEVRREIPNISLGTVYRNLKLLKQEGKVLELDLAGSLSRFDGNTHNHYHFRCEQCGRIFDVDEPADQEINDKVARETGFKVSHHILEFRVYLEDTDAQGIVYYANYLRFFERGRSEILESLGIPMNEVARPDSRLVVYEIRVKFRRPVLLGDRIEVVTSMARESAYRLNFRQQIRRKGSNKGRSPKAVSSIIQSSSPQHNRYCHREKHQLLEHGKIIKTRKIRLRIHRCPGRIDKHRSRCHQQ